MEFKNAVEEIEKLYQSCENRFDVITAQMKSKPGTSTLSQAYENFKHAIESKKCVDVLSRGFKDIVPDTKTVKSIRKVFDFAPETIKPNMNFLLYRRTLNFVFLDLFKSHYEKHELAKGDRFVVALMVYEMVMSIRQNTDILSEKLSKFSYKNYESTYFSIIVEVILLETIKNFQIDGNLVYLVSLCSYLLEDPDKSEQRKQIFVDGLELLADHIDTFTLAGMENLATWFAHFKINKRLPLMWMKKLKTSDKGKFLISAVLRSLMQLSSYSQLAENPELGEFLSFMPVDPKPKTSLTDPGHIRHTDYQLLLEKFRLEVPSEEMTRFLSNNELSCYGPELQELFLLTMYDKCHTSLNDLNLNIERYYGILRDLFKKTETSPIDALKITETYWINSHLHIVVIFDKFVRKELVDIKTISKYLIQRSTDNDVTLEKNSLYFKALKSCLKVVSLNRKKLEADTSEKLAHIVKRHRAEFFEILVEMIEVATSYLDPE